MADQIVTDRELYLIAKDALANSYAPFSKFRVGAALLTAEDRVYSGVNVENSTYGATICAERTAIVKAVSEGSRRFKAIAVATDEGAVTPCGICRQFLFEFGDDIRVIWGTDADHLETALVAELLPRGFRL